MGKSLNEYEINRAKQIQYDFAYRYNFNLCAMNHFIHDIMNIDSFSSSKESFEELLSKEANNITEQEWVVLQTKKINMLLDYELKKHNYNIDEVLQLLHQENIINFGSELLDYAMQSLQIGNS